MAINSHEKLGAKIGPAIKSSCSKSSNQSLRGLLKIDYSADGSISSSDYDKSMSKKNLSPYLAEDRVQMLSRITEKRLVRKKTTDFTSSYPLAINIYKASSDEFKALKKSKKVKKSVLTLPNEPAPLPQACTVSDMNDSEYFDGMKHERTSRPKKRRTQTNRRPRMNKAMEVFDRDAEYCSRLNIDLDNSSTEMINQLTGDGKKKISIKCRNNKPKESDIKAHDVWAMLRNMNRFPFRTSPPLSDDSIASNKRNTYNKHRNSRMDTKFIETCTTEEFTFFSNSVNKSAHNSQSSIDRVTVIDKQNEYQELCEEKVIKNKIPPKIRTHQKNKNKKLNVKAKEPCGKVISDGGDSDKFFHHNDVNLKQRNEFSKSLRNKAHGQENKYMLPYDASNHTKVSIYNRRNNISRKDSKEFNVSEDHLTSDSCNVIKDQTTSKKISSCDLQGPINGITKVVLSKGSNIVLTKKDDNPKRKPCLVTTTPNAALYSKLIQPEIKRLKSPLVILAKDRLTADSFQIKNYEPPKFTGLDEHIMSPFMQNWQTKGSKAFQNSNVEFNSVYEKASQDIKGDYVRWKNNDMKINEGKKYFPLKDKIAVQPILIPNAKTNANNKAQKTMAQFKEIIGSNRNKCIPKEYVKRTEVYNNSLVNNTNTQCNLVLSNEQNGIITKNEKMLKYKVSSNIKQPCGKGSWASEFIDNVIKKLKSGVYYNQDDKDMSRNHCCKTKEESVQTEINFAKHDCHSEEFNSVYGKASQGIKGNYVLCKNDDIKIDKGKKYFLSPNAKNINNKAQKTMAQFKEIIDCNCKKCIPKEFRKRTVVYNNPLDNNTNTQSNIVSSNKQHEIFNKKEKMLKYKVSSNMKQPSAKGSWASDIIDNVIKKLKSGAYYNQDEKDISRNHYCSFDNRVSDLKIESINKNQIAIKHCITNIIVQFDVVTPSQIDPMLQVTQSSISCLPMSVTESDTRIFKSQITIVNAMLPAELCSILPKMMKKITDSKVVIPKIVHKADCHLSPIVELTRYESGDSIKRLIPAQIETSPKIRSLGQGNFSNNVSTTANKTSDKTKIGQDYCEELYSLNIADYLPKYINANLLFSCQIDPMALLVFESRQSIETVPETHLAQQKITSCMELKPYLPSNDQIIPVFTKFYFIDIAARILSNQNFSIQLTIPIVDQLNDLYYKNNVNTISIGLNTYKNKGFCIISDATVDSLYNDFQGRLKDSNPISSILKLDQKYQISDKINEYTDRSQINKFGKFQSSVEYCVTNSKIKKRSFVKLSKKCKSMSSMISNERSSTALEKITNLDDFFLALGSAKTLTSVFDRTAERKILTSIKDMKSWINDITPRQALLVLLLANKKDTSNLVRYRSVILQGIAVKRITRASELDMEIEVIERENLNTFSQYEGISYLPASVENQDSLLEELNWIAKTTASDYQKPFDESSERLLKSLLEKRKKLNPSYLRVMARYVGLGLVKSPK
ncbi:uncharacterized protein [Maniola hyperantus]|uniref:uncharacterized protein n=1 Tax=Aphantopus hyperantus TaxID=2795564 RepID=UPI00374A1D40